MHIKDGLVKILTAIRTVGGWHEYDIDREFYDAVCENARKANMSAADYFKDCYSIGDIVHGVARTKTGGNLLLYDGSIVQLTPLKKKYAMWDSSPSSGELESQSSDEPPSKRVTFRNGLRLVHSKDDGTD